MASGTPASATLLCGAEVFQGLRVPTNVQTEARQLTCPLEKMNTRAAPAAVIPQVKKVPSKAWNTVLWPWSILDTAVCKGARDGQCPQSLSGTPMCSNPST